MNDTVLTNDQGRPTKFGMRSMMALALIGASGMTSGCVSVTAPDKPIEINLNINVTQEVVYRLDSDAKTAIQQNPGIF